MRDVSPDTGRKGSGVLRRLQPEGQQEEWDADGGKQENGPAGVGLRFLQSFIGLRTKRLDGRILREV